MTFDAVDREDQSVSNTSADTGVLLTDTEAAAEERLMEKAAKLMEEAEEAAPSPEEFTKEDASRFEPRRSLPASPEADEEAEDTSSSKWGPAPSVRDQMVRYPDSVRLVDPETKVLSLADSKQLVEFNRIQKAASDPEKPTLAVTELERQPFEGSWTVIVTFSKVQYQQL